MATFQDMQTYVSKRLLDPSNTAVSVPDVADAINNSIRYWKYRRFWFNTDDTQVTMVQGQSNIDLSPIADFLVEIGMNDGFVIEYSGMRYPIIKRNPRDFDDEFLTNGAGRPMIYTVKSGTYYFYFIPDQAYTLRVYYLKDYTDLALGTDTNDFSVNASRLIELWSLADLSAELRQDDKMEAYYRNAALDEYKNLGVMNSKVNSPGHVTIHSFL